MSNSYPIDPAPANGRADGWFCPACHSLNRPGVSRCYSCRANTPLVASVAPASRNRGWVGILLVITLVFAGLGGSVVFGRTTATQPKPTDSSSEMIALVSDGNTLPTGGDSAASDSATPSAVIPSMSTSEVTFIPQSTAAPTPRTTPAPVPVATAAPTSAAATAPTPRTTPTPTSRATAAPAPVATAAPTAPPDDTVALPRFSYSVTGVTVKYLPIAGDTPYALLQADEAASTKACKVDSLACFYADYSWSFTGRTDDNGVFVISSTDLIISYTIILPNWTSPARVPAILVSWWKAVMDHIVWHESQHLAIAREYAPQIKVAMQNARTGAGSSAATQAVLDDENAAQDAFDAQQKAAAWQYPLYSGTWGN